MATCTVTKFSDSGSGSQREAVGLANADADADTIQFLAGRSGTIDLLGELALSADLRT